MCGSFLVCLIFFLLSALLNPFGLGRTHLEDVYDLAWSPNSQYLVSGSVDNTVVVWNVDKGYLYIAVTNNDC